MESKSEYVVELPDDSKLLKRQLKIGKLNYLSNYRLVKDYNYSKIYIWFKKLFNYEIKINM